MHLHVCIIGWIEDQGSDEQEVKMKKRIPWIIFILGTIILAINVVLGAPVLPFHVTAACGCYLFFIACVVINIGIQCGRKWPQGMAVSCCEAGIFFALETMLSGAWWGYHAWGAAWVWEPRITGMFLMTLFFVSWRIAVVILGEEALINKKLTASLIILGLPAMFFTHMAVRLFGGIHPSAIAPAHHVGVEAIHVILAILGQISIGMGLAWGRKDVLKKGSV